MGAGTEAAFGDWVVMATGTKRGEKSGSGSGSEPSRPSTIGNVSMSGRGAAVESAMAYQEPAPKPGAAMTPAAAMESGSRTESEGS